MNQQPKGLMDDLLDAKQVMKELKISRPTLNRMQKKPDFPPCMRRNGTSNGALRYWRRTDIEAWLESRFDDLN